MQHPFFRSNVNWAASSGPPLRRLIRCLIMVFVCLLVACQSPVQDTDQIQGIPEVEADSDSGTGAPAEESGEHEIEIRFVNGGGEEPLIQPNSGWPLTLSLAANEEKLLGIGHTGWQPDDPYPDASSTGYIVFEDLDGCPSWVPAEWQKEHIQTLEDEGRARYEDCLQPPASPWPEDEVLVEISPRLEVRDEPCGDMPELWVWEQSKESENGTNSRLISIGPCVGSEDDGYGYGRNPRLPGLVLLADAGPGVVTDENFDRPSSLDPPLPVEMRNLAGFFQSVTYELKDARSRTSILVHMNVPEGLFSPVALVDDCVKRRRGRKTCFRVDGAPKKEVDRGSQVVSIRAFMVNQQAPDRLTDANGDGVVDAEDAEYAGLRLLSGQAVLRLKVPLVRVAKDLDGDGDAMEEGDGPPPADPGTLTDPPR